MSETVQTTATEQPAAQMQIADLLVAIQAIQIASSRGAFRAEEMSQVGGCYDRIVAFLKSSGALQPAQSAEQEQPAGEETTAESAE